MKLIVGLGNPGSEYANTRHNAGFMAVQHLARKHGLAGAKTNFHAQVLEGLMGGHKAMLMQPMTYMNRSGLAVGEATRFYRLGPADVIVLVDDFALPLGTVRLRGSGGAGGHNGLADVQRALGTDVYPRLRIGVGSPQVNGQPIPHIDHVLGKFTDDQLHALQPALESAAQAVETWLTEGLEASMNRYNKNTNPVTPNPH